MLQHKNTLYILGKNKKSNKCRNPANTGNGKEKMLTWNSNTQEKKTFGGRNVKHT